MTGIPGPIPPKLPIRSLPRGEKAMRELYNASFIGHWRSYLFWASAFLAFLVFLFFLDFLG